MQLITEMTEQAHPVTPTGAGQLGFLPERWIRWMGVRSICQIRKSLPPVQNGTDRLSRRHCLTGFILLCGLICLTGCSTLSRYNFLQPNKDWQTRSGQLQYRNARTTMTGDVVVRTSKRGDFELTFSKGPGVNLLVIQQDEHEAQVKGPIARLGWSGPVERAPKQLRGWLSLREKLLQEKDRSSVTQKIGTETFSFRF